MTAAQILTLSGTAQEVRVSKPASDIGGCLQQAEQVQRGVPTFPFRLFFPQMARCGTSRADTVRDPLLAHSLNVLDRYHVAHWGLHTC